MRDRYGITQIIFDPNYQQTTHQEANVLRSEFVIQVQGSVRARPEGQANKNIATGEVEIIIDTLVILSKSKTPPFELDIHTQTANEDIRYKHRYIDLRRKNVLNNVIFRSKFLNFTRNWFAQNDFLEVQTPIFTSSSPE